jgi:hypothetical protein
VAWVGDYLPDYKVAPELADLLAIVKNRSPAELREPLSSSTVGGDDSATRSAVQFLAYEAYEQRAALAQGMPLLVHLDVSFPHLRHDAERLPDNPVRDSREADPHGYEPAAAAAVDWQAPLREMCDACQLRPGSRMRLGLSVPVDKLQVSRPRDGLPEHERSHLDWPHHVSS